MKLTNMQIYNYANNLSAALQDFTSKLSVKVNFYLQKNKNLLLELAQDIEKARIEIIQERGTLNEETNQYDIPDDKMQEVIKELDDLFKLEQEVNIYTVSIDDFGVNTQFTPAQMEALMFMIE